MGDHGERNDQSDHGRRQSDHGRRQSGYQEGRSYQKGEAYQEKIQGRTFGQNPGRLCEQKWKVDYQKSLKTLKTPISKGRRLSRRDDVVTFKDSFCLDYLGKDFSPCYDVVTSSQGKRLEELSWSIRVAALKKASEEDKKKGGKVKVVEAVKEGAAFDDVKILCGRLFKQLGRFSDRQITKLSENSVVDDNDKYRHQKQGDRMLRTAAKIAQKAEDLNLVSSS